MSRIPNMRPAAVYGSIGVINFYNQILASTVSKNEKNNECQARALNQGFKSVLDFWYALNHFKWKYAEFCVNQITQSSSS